MTSVEERVEEVVDKRTKPAFFFVLATLALTILALIAAIVVTYLAYERQSDRVARVAEENSKLEQDHTAIGTKFAQQSKELEAAVAEARQAYTRGLDEGKQLRLLPPKLRPLEDYAENGYLIPRQVPKPLRGRPIAIGKQPSGYTVRWKGLALFASAEEPVQIWTRQAWPGRQRELEVGGRKMRRLVGPAGIIYAWAEDGRTYAVLTLPRNDRLAVQLLGTLS